MNEKEKADLKKLYEMNPDFYKRSEADKKKYGEERLKRLNQETIREVIEHNRKIYEETKKLPEKATEIVKEEAKFLKRGRSWLITKHYKDNA